MKVKMDLGFDRFEELKEKIEKMRIPLPVDLEYVRRYEKDWRTAYISKEEDLDKIVIKSVDGTPLAIISPYPGFPEKWVMESGEYISSLKEGKEYIFGREPNYTLSTLHDFYYVSIKPDGKYDKRLTGIRVPRDVSRIHCYVRDLGNEIEIARLGITPINIEFSKYKSNIWL